MVFSRDITAQKLNIFSFPIIKEFLNVSLVTYVKAIVILRK